MKVTKNELMLAVSFLSAFVAFALPYGYMQTYLIYVGYNGVERGYILAGSAFIAIVLQFIAGYLCDYFRTDKKIFNIGMLMLMISTYLMFMVTDQQFWFHFLFVSLVGGLCRSIMVVQDAWCLETDETCKNHYGPLRSLGSIGWMIGSTLGAWIIASYGYAALGTVFCVMGVVNILITMFMQDAIKVEKENKEKISMADIKLLFSNKKYIIIVLIFLVINMIAAADQYTVVDKMYALGADETLVGQRWTIQAFTELPLFFAGAWLIKKFGDYKLMVFGAIMYIVKFLAYGVVQTPELIIVAACLQGVTYPLIMITSKTLVDVNTPVQIRASGQTIASALYLGIALLATPIIASFLNELVGIDYTLYIFAFSGVIALILAFIYKRLD